MTEIHINLLSSHNLIEQDGKQYQPEADAMLISAAPELLSVVQGALRISELWMPPDDENNPEHDAEFASLAMMRNQFKEVVNKATGANQ